MINLEKEYRVEMHEDEGFEYILVIYKDKEKPLYYLNNFFKLTIFVDGDLYKQPTTKDKLIGYNYNKLKLNTNKSLDYNETLERLLRANKELGEDYLYYTGDLIKAVIDHHIFTCKD